MTEDSEADPLPPGAVRIDVEVSDDVPEAYKSRSVLAAVSLLFAEGLQYEAGDDDAAITMAVKLLRRSFAYLRYIEGVEAAEAAEAEGKPRH